MNNGGKKNKYKGFLPKKGLNLYKDNHRHLSYFLNKKQEKFAPDYITEDGGAHYKKIGDIEIYRLNRMFTLKTDNYKNKKAVDRKHNEMKEMLKDLFKKIKGS